MPKIPNWTKQADHVWKNDITGSQISLMSYKTPRGQKRYAYTLMEEGSLEDERPYRGDDFKNKEKALESARNWMKKHPDI